MQDLTPTCLLNWTPELLQLTRLASLEACTPVHQESPLVSCHRPELSDWYHTLGSGGVSGWWGGSVRTANSWAWGCFPTLLGPGAPEALCVAVWKESHLSPHLSTQTT